MPQALVGCGGFLLAVLWFDLMFDVQAAGTGGAALPEAVLDSIARYYRRVTTDAAPMGSAVGAVMLFTVAGVSLQLRKTRLPFALRAGALGTSVLPVAVALFWVFPAAVQLGARQDPVAIQSALARGILTGHVACLASIAVFCGLQIAIVRLLHRDARGASGRGVAAGPPASARGEESA